jgi:hypothetical protein
MDSDGGPIPGLRLLVNLETNRLKAETDAKGVALLTPDERVTEVIATSSSRVHLVPRPREIGPGEHEITFVLERSGRASGRLIAPDGRPLSAAAGIDVMRNGETLVSTYAKPDGTFRAYVPANGTFDLVLNGKVRPSDQSKEEAYAEEQFFYAGKLEGVTAGQEDLILRVKPVTFDRSLTIEVRDPANEPIEGVLILVAPTKPGAGYVYFPTGSDGSVTLSDLPSRPIVVRYGEGEAHHKAGFAPPPDPARRVIPFGQTVVFQLRATAVVSGVVSFSDGSAAPGAEISAWAKVTQHVGRAVCDGSGRFEIRVPVDAMPMVIGASCRRKRDGRRYSAHVRVASAADRVRLSLVALRD